MTYIRWTQSASTARLSRTRDRITRLNIYPRPRRMSARIHARIHRRFSTKSHHSSGHSREPCILDISLEWEREREREGEGKTDRTSATYRRQDTWRQYLSISIRPFFREAVERACPVRMQDYVTRVGKIGMTILFSSLFFCGMENSVLHNAMVIR